ncbi:MAG: hypothetical protein U0800_13100 [Isosphaeraceae bacterium]
MSPPSESPETEDRSRPSRQGQGGGPRTPFGKAASSQNATTHGSTAIKRLPNYFQRQVDERMTFYVPRYQPIDDEDNFLCAQAAIGYARNRHAMHEAYQYLAIRSERAQLYWHQDRRGEVGRLGARLAKRPSEIAPKLEASLHGARWMLERWEHLRALLLMEADGETDGVWVDETVSMAYDLLGIDPALRDSDPKGLARGSREERLAVIDAEMDRLREMTTGLYFEHDKNLRLKAICGDAYMNAPDYRRLLRYAREGELLNERCLKELERRRIARNLPAYTPDGTPYQPIDPPGTPPRPAPEPLPEDEVAFYGTLNKKPVEPVSHDREMAEAERRATGAESRPQPNEAPEAARPRISPDEARRKANEARLNLEADRKAARQEKARIRAERKATKAARQRGRSR